jgi:hypothetical protein
MAAGVPEGHGNYEHYHHFDAILLRDGRPTTAASVSHDDCNSYSNTQFAQYVEYSAMTASGAFVGGHASVAGTAALAATTSALVMVQSTHTVFQVRSGASF